MFGWFSDASVLASRSKRASRSGSCAKASGRILIATCRPRLVSVARYTSPMPPTPIWAVISYGPRRVPAVRATASGCDYRRCRGESGYVTGNGAVFPIDCGAYPCLPHGSLERRLARKESSWRVARLPGYGSSCRRGSTFPFVPLVHPPKNREVDWNLTSAGITGHGRRFVHRHRVPHQSLRARGSARECRAGCSLIGPPEDVISPNR